MSCAYRELDEGEPLEAGDWWAFKPTGLDDRMTFSADNWFDHDELGKCFRITAKQAAWINSLEREADESAIFREDFEDF